MYKAVHNYTDTSAQNHTLPFNSGDMLCVLEKTNSTWWLASNTHGKIGYVPAAYIKPYEKDNSNDIILQSVDRAIAAIYASADNDSLTSEQKGVLRKLNKHKQEIISSSRKAPKEAGKRRAPPPPPSTQRTATTYSIENPPPPPQRSLSTKQIKHAPPVPGSQEQKEIDETTSSLVTSAETLQITAQNEQIDIKEEEMRTNHQESFNPKVPAHLGVELVNHIQSEYRLTEINSRDIIKSVLLAIGENIPTASAFLEEIVETLPVIEITTDPVIEKLRMCLVDMTEIKNDAQQRSWAIEDDRGKITSILNQIMESLTSGLKEECIEELTQDQYEYVIMLTTYHQMEPRVDIRLLVLQVLGIICSLSSKFVSVLLTTVLPNELVRDITDHTDDIQRVCYSGLVLSMVFSTGEPIPVIYYDTIGINFLTFLLDSIENGLDTDTDDRVGDIFVRLILAYNLHLIDPETNLTMQAITSRTSCTTLSEKVMLLVNRGDDPVKITDDETHGSLPPNSVLKFLQDIFLRNDTALSFLYTNDLLVLTDIMCRNIADLPPGSQIRTEYLDLLLNVVVRSSYQETKHRASEILATLERIKNEELPAEKQFLKVVEFDKKIVNTILEEHISCFV